MNNTETIVTRTATENELAESLGFTCEIDHRRGGTFCKFKTETVHVWEILKTGIGVFWSRAELVNGHFEQHRQFGTLEDALRDVNPVFVCGEYGLFERVK